ncbi:MAG: hypothetical protein JOZ73_06245 [Solirubrobacterales bacterium]|nr:hypothetical protein [Solirubrobacterales bacterium]
MPDQRPETTLVPAALANEVVIAIDIATQSKPTKRGSALLRFADISTILSALR